MQQTASCSRPKQSANAASVRSRRVVVVQLRQRGQPVGFADHQAAQLHDRFRNTACR